MQLRGAVTVDAGAAAEVRASGKSLLPIGVVAVDGDFERGEVIAVRGWQRREIGAGPRQLQQRRGAADRAQAVARDRALLGYIGEPELIHRDNFVLS